MSVRHFHHDSTMIDKPALRYSQNNQRPPGAPASRLVTPDRIAARMTTSMQILVVWEDMTPEPRSRTITRGISEYSPGWNGTAR